LRRVERITSVGTIPIKGKTILPTYEEVLPIDGFWHLTPDTYNITFDQGCNIPNDQMLLIRQRSSLLRCGGQLHSSIFDAGFFTDHISTFMNITKPINIEVGARVAQIYNHATDTVENLYAGQFQNDIQRKS
jgi:deoxycytidine triphosphate deaminase